MEIKLNDQGAERVIDEFGKLEECLNAVKEELWGILTDVEDYWIGRSGDSFKYICWYLKLLLDTGIDDFVDLKDEITETKKSMAANDMDLSNQIESR